jgi:outer membrane lipopolysaccharide assembly protein LptE/RlpB
MTYVHSGEIRLPIRFRRILRLTCLFMAAITAFGCGYHFQQAARLPGDAKRLYVDIFENRTNQAGLETTVTNAVVFEFVKRGETDMVKEPSQADLIMKGVIHSVQVSTAATRNKDAAGERQVTITLDVRLLQQDGKVVWSASGLKDGDAYVVGADKFLNDDKQRATLGIVSTRIAERIQPLHRYFDDFVKRPICVALHLAVAAAY